MSPPLAPLLADKLSRGLACGLALLLTAAPMAKAALTWASQKSDLVTTSRESQAVALFPFRNSGPTPVTITGLTTDCGCTVAELAKDTYAPGEAGTVKVTFTIGARTGLHEKHIEVMTDAAGAKPVTLLLRVDIQQLVSATPQKVVWPAGENPTEKLVEIAAGSAHAITSLQVTVTPTDIVTTEIVAVEAGRKYQVKIKPLSARRPLDATVSCLVKFEDKLFQRIPLVVRVE